MKDISVQKLNEILDELNIVNAKDDNTFRRLSERVKGIAKNIFSSNSTYIEDILILQKKVNENPYGLSPGHIEEMIGIVQIMLDELEITNTFDKVSTISNTNSEVKKPLTEHKIANDNLKVFIVHGHNEAMKEATARTIEKLGLNAIILHEKANAGDTIFEKFTRHSDVGFAVVLLSADDYGYSRTEGASKAKLRARQNVIFELGFFYSKLGRKRVVAIYEQDKDFEKPSDIDGIVYIPYGQDGKWRLDLVRELLEIGYQVDANALIR